MRKFLNYLMKRLDMGGLQKSAVSASPEDFLPYSGLKKGLRFTEVHGFRSICCGSCVCYAGTAASDAARCEFPPPGRRASVRGLTPDLAALLGDPAIKAVGAAGGFVPIVGVCAFWRERGTVPGLWGDVPATAALAAARGIPL